MGSFSRIEKTTGDKVNYELYGSGDLHFGRLLHNRRFDIAMVAFLDCLKHLMDHIKFQDPNIDFPHQCVLCKETTIAVAYSIKTQDHQGQNR
jgi:beclin 1